MDKFDLEEQKGRRIFESFLSQAKNTSNWNPTTDKYNPVDGFFELNGKKIVVEIKTRDKRYMNYITHLIQIDKLLCLHTLTAVNPRKE